MLRYSKGRFQFFDIATIEEANELKAILTNIQEKSRKNPARTGALSDLFNAITKKEKLQDDLSSPKSPSSSSTPKTR